MEGTAGVIGAAGNEADRRAVTDVAEEAARAGALLGRDSHEGLAPEDLLTSPEIRRQGSLERLVKEVGQPQPPVYWSTRVITTIL